MRLSLPAPDPIFSVTAKFGKVMLAFPFATFIVTISEPIVNVVAVKFAKFTVTPAATLIMRFDIPETVSVSTMVSPLKWAPVTVPV